LIGVGVVGYGYWGPNFARNFAESSRCRLVAVSDLSEDRLARAAVRHPGVSTTPDDRALIDDSRVDAVAIATPVGSHGELALRALRAGKHVLVSKPLASSSEQARALVDEADLRGLVLMVDHTFLYAGAVRKIRDLVAGGELGQIHYYDSVRVNLGLFQRDVNVIWDLAVHDLSILDFVLPDRPRAVSAIGMSHVPGTPENLAYVTLLFDGRLIAHTHVNWLAPVKVRRTLIGGSAKMIVYDDLEPSEKVKLYESGVTVTEDPNDIYRILFDYRTGDMWAPQLSRDEALKTEVAEFLDCVENGTTPLSDGRAGLRLVRLLEAATVSLGRQGGIVELARD